MNAAAVPTDNTSRGGGALDVPLFQLELASTDRHAGHIGDMRRESVPAVSLHKQLHSFS